MVNKFSRVVGAYLGEAAGGAGTDARYWWCQGWNLPLLQPGRWRTFSPHPTMVQEEVRSRRSQADVRRSSGEPRATRATPTCALRTTNTLPINIKHTHRFIKNCSRGAYVPIGGYFVRNSIVCRTRKYRRVSNIHKLCSSSDVTHLLKSVLVVSRLSEAEWSFLRN